MLKENTRKYRKSLPHPGDSRDNDLNMLPEIPSFIIIFMEYSKERERGVKASDIHPITQTVLSLLHLHPREEEGRGKSS